MWPASDATGLLGHRLGFRYQSPRSPSAFFPHLLPSFHLLLLQERPYMLDIGANLGVYTILGASRGCRSVSFEPLSQNILRLSASLQASGWAER